MGALVATVLAVLMARHRFRWAAYLAITSLGGALLNQLLKFHYVRQRPDLKAAVLDAMGYSFPSGHAMSATIILGAFAYLAARSAREWKHKSAALAALATLALAIGTSRLYLGVHWASDVGPSLRPDCSGCPRRRRVTSSSGSSASAGRAWRSAGRRSPRERGPP